MKLSALNGCKCIRHFANIMSLREFRRLVWVYVRKEKQKSENQRTSGQKQLVNLVAGKGGRGAKSPPSNPPPPLLPLPPPLPPSLSPSKPPQRTDIQDHVYGMPNRLLLSILLCLTSSRAMSSKLIWTDCVLSSSLGVRGSSSVFSGAFSPFCSPWDKRNEIDHDHFWQFRS